MYEIKISRVKAETSLEDAINEMKNSGRSAVAVELPDGIALLTASELHAADKKSVHTVSELNPSTAAYQVPLPGNAEDILYSPIARRGLEVGLASRGAQYSIIDVADPRQACVVTSSTALASTLSQPDTK